jgi:hypothetical protein
VNCGLNHGLAPGDSVTIAGGTNSFRGTFPVANVLAPHVFTYGLPVTGSGGAATVSYTKTVSVNVAIQSNAAVKVGGNVTIGGVGVPGSFLSTGTGVGIDPHSHFTLNGGLGATQSVAIVPPVGYFHVGEGTDGGLTGAAARAMLLTNLVVAGSLDVNGASVITGASAEAGIVLTDGANAAIGTDGAIAIAGGLVVGSGSIVDLSVGELAVGALDVSSGGAIDLKNRREVIGHLRVRGNVVPHLRSIIVAGGIRHAGRLDAYYNPIGDYTSVQPVTSAALILAQ